MSKSFRLVRNDGLLVFHYLDHKLHDIKCVMEINISNKKYLTKLFCVDHILSCVIWCVNGLVVMISDFSVIKITADTEFNYLQLSVAQRTCSPLQELINSCVCTKSISKSGMFTKLYLTHLQNKQQNITDSNLTLFNSGHEIVSLHTKYSVLYKDFMII